MRAAPAPPAEPVEEYVAALDAALIGPRRAKSRLLAEIRDGLSDTVAAYADAGLTTERAADRAVREFGTPRELIPSCQRELTIAQARHTARVIALTAPFLLACWYLTGSAGTGTDWLLPRLARTLALQLSGVAGLAALLAAAALAATGTLARRLPVPHRLPLAVAWTATTAGAAMAAATILLVLATLLAANAPLLALATTLSAFSHATIATAARTCRRCAHRAAPVGTV
ncbi:permease prefix domain 1-containing protein [Streptomyces sp. DSM 44917]|uniref:Permease prefix domain 1-containing protein n=1 Tax=Streptomyces boetiae TaxID=3075541 RepID=A0ABU2LF42_9ACTN|nr:permease prefix domain 1-containing protein [Streptomyces sp. DSM 44917]MDT0310191.1 permease prefix domain 1-containing protein [Streptomyces sp. DSM 44917]